MAIIEDKDLGFYFLNGNPKVGDIFNYGSYNGHRIIWKILKIQDRMALVITTDNVCKMPYHEPGGNITWSDCTLRRWLNSDFINGYFTQAERARILSIKLKNDNNLKYKTPGGIPTTDKVFLLSINEAKTLFASKQARTNGSWWWLRSPGDYPHIAAFVYIGGEVDTIGTDVGDDGGVRPALWLNLNL